MKIYTTLGYIVSLILLHLEHVFRFRIVSRIFKIVSSKESLFFLFHNLHLFPDTCFAIKTSSCTWCN